jgi:hypothetical protein
MAMMGDDRACAKAVGAMMTPKEQAGPRVSERQVEEHPRCFLFGHYDSRGGACLVRARNLLEAFEKYATEAFSWQKDPATGRLEDPGMREYMKDDAEYEAWRPDALHALMEEDFMFSCNVVVCDQTFEESGTSDLDVAYDESGYRYGVLQYRWLHKHWSEDAEERRELSKWTSAASGCKKTLVFWKGKDRPKVDPSALGPLFGHLAGLEVRILKRKYGEDAFGVSWIP